MSERIYSPKYFKRFKKDQNCGVYQIRNIENGKLYIGSSKRIGARKRQHFSDLKCQRHPNRYLQRAYNKYGKDKFIFEVIEFCSEEDRISEEQYWVNRMQTFHSNKKGYNISEVVDIPQACVGSANIKSKKTIHVNTGKIYSSARIGAAETGQSYSAVRNCCLKKRHMKSGDVWRFVEDYEKLTEEEKEQLMKKKEWSKRVICLENKKVFESIGAAANFFNLNKRNISSCCLRERNSINGVHFLFVDDYESRSKQEIEMLLRQQDGRKPVIDILNGKIYSDGGACATENGVDRKSIYNHCHGINKRVRFMFYEDYIKLSSESIQEKVEKYIKYIKA